MAENKRREHYDDWRKTGKAAPGAELDPGAVGGAAGGIPAGYFQMGIRGFT